MRGSASSSREIERRRVRRAAVAFAATHDPALGRAAARAELDRLFARFPLLAARADVKAARLSGGEQQVLALVRALAGRPRVLIVDEPAEGLAPLAVDEVRACLAALQADGVAILLIEQRLQLAPRLAHRVAVMGRGTIVYDGALDGLGDDTVRAWLGTG